MNFDILITLEQLWLQLCGIILEILLWRSFWFLWLHRSFHDQHLYLIYLLCEALSLFLNEVPYLIDFLYFLWTQFKHIFKLKWINEASVLVVKAFSFGAIKTRAHGWLLVLVEGVGHLRGASWDTGESGLWPHVLVDVVEYLLIFLVLIGY